jgi:FtsP/CotA-like multicopper oxidase with cupredoxin domain
VQNDGRGPTDTLVAPGMPVLRFDVGDAAADPSVLPPPVTAFDPPDVASAVKTRLFEFNRDNGAWAVNGNFFDLDRVDAAPLVDSAEIWILKNGGGGWNHPIHIHFEEFRILSRNGRKPPLFEQGRKDVANLGPGEEVRVLMKFRDFAGTTGFNNQYVMHCHNLVHEDHAMMIRFDVAAAKA